MVRGWRAVGKDGEPGLRMRRSGGCGQVPQSGQDLGKQAVAGRQPQAQVAGVADQPAGDGDQPRLRISHRPGLDHRPSGAPSPGTGPMRSARSFRGMVVTASSASARIWARPWRHSSARSRASHGPIEELPSGRLAATSAPSSASLAHRSASADLPARADSTATKTASPGWFSTAWWAARPPTRSDASHPAPAARSTPTCAQSRPGPPEDAARHDQVKARPARPSRSSGLPAHAAHAHADEAPPRCLQPQHLTER